MTWRGITGPSCGLWWIFERRQTTPTADSRLEVVDLEGPDYRICEYDGLEWLDGPDALDALGALGDLDDFIGLDGDVDYDLDDLAFTRSRARTRSREDPPPLEPGLEAKLRSRYA